MKQPAVVGDINDPSRAPAPLTDAECETTVTFQGIPVAVAQPTGLVHPELGNPPAFPATGSTSVTIGGLDLHRVGDSRESGSLTVTLNPNPICLIGD